jgi:hypothetical protein
MRTVFLHSPTTTSEASCRTNFLLSNYRWRLRRKPEQTSVPATMQTRWFPHPQTAAEIAAIRDVELQIVLGCVKIIEDYDVTSKVPTTFHLAIGELCESFLCSKQISIAANLRTHLHRHHQKAEISVPTSSAISLNPGLSVVPKITIAR